MRSMEAHSYATRGEASEDLKSRAEEFRKELLLGITRTKEVVAWADARIAAKEKPDISVIDLALAVGRPAWEVADLLKAFPGNARVDVVQRYVFCKLRDILRREPEQIRRVCSILLTLAMEDFAPSADVRNEMYLLEDYLECAHAGIYGNVDEIRREVQGFLDRICE